MATTLAAVFLLSLFLVLNHLPLWHTDIWAHLRFGEWINSNGHLPDREPFSAWSETKPYVPMAWLSQVLLAWVYDWGSAFSIPSVGGEGVRPGGVDALRFLAAALVAARFLLLYFAYRRYTQSASLALIGIIFCLSLSFTHIDVLRPQVFGELCLAAMLFATCKPLPSRLASWLVPLLLAIWANLHGSFLNGLLVLLGVMAGRFFQEIRESREMSPLNPPVIKGGRNGLGRQLFRSPAMRRLFRMFYLSVIAIGFLNPLGSFRWYAETWSFAGNPNVAMMDEWQPLDWFSPSGWVFAGSLVVVLGTHFLARWRSKQGINFGHWLLVLCFGLQVIFYQRMLPWWAMLAPYVCLSAWKRIQDRGERSGVRGQTVPSPLTSHTSPLTAKRWMSWVVVILALWVGFSWSTLGLLVLQKQATPLDQSLHPGTPRLVIQAMLQPSLPTIPKDLTDWLRTSHGPIFCSETLGDYLLFASPRPPIIYSHVQLFPVEHWQRCLAVKNGDQGWAGILRTWNANMVLVEAELHPRLCGLLRQDKEWKVIVDEAGKTSKRDPKARHFLAVRINGR
jgi:hypothetical protein